MFRAHWNLESVGPERPPCALAIGNFDGLHLGHQRIIEKTKEQARRIGGEAVVLTFDPHPATVVAPERAPDLLMLPAERLRRLEECGMDAGVVLTFTEEIARLRPEEFVEQILVRKLNVAFGGGWRGLPLRMPPERRHEDLDRYRFSLWVRGGDGPAGSGRR